MPVYEYRVVQMEPVRLRAQAQCDALGLEGWALVTITPRTEITGQHGYFMRRPDEQPRPRTGITLQPNAENPEPTE